MSIYDVRGLSQLPAGAMANAIVAKYVAHGKTHALIFHPNGFIYGTCRQSAYDIRDMSRYQRAAWCRLTGITNKALTAAVKEHEAEQRKLEVRSDIARLRRDAARIGYSLIPKSKMGVHT